MSFLPTTYEKIPTNSDYMKLADGDNNFRVLSSAVVGFEYWNLQDKPVRSKEGWDYIPADCKPDQEGKYSVRHFWAFVVWNYDDKRVQILQIAQKKIMEALKALVDNPRWGDPKNYDITINRKGQGFDTKYIVQANPPIAPADPKILEAYAKKPVNLEALFSGADPFAGRAESKPAPAEIQIEQAPPEAIPAKSDNPLDYM